MIKIGFLIITTLSLTLLATGCQSPQPTAPLPRLSIKSPSVNVNGAAIEPGMTKPEVMRKFRNNKNVLLPLHYRNKRSVEYRSNIWEIPIIFITRYALLKLYYKDGKIVGTHITELE